MAGKFELKHAGVGEFMFNLKSPNGEKILTSELYKSRSGAENGIASVRVNAVLDRQYERKNSSRMEPYFILKAGNGETIGTSEMYSTTAARENGIESVKQNAPSAVIEDLA